MALNRLVLELRSFAKLKSRRNWRSRNPLFSRVDTDPQFPQSEIDLGLSNLGACNTPKVSAEDMTVEPFSLSH